MTAVGTGVATTPTPLPAGTLVDVSGSNGSQRLTPLFAVSGPFRVHSLWTELKGIDTVGESASADAETLGASLVWSGSVYHFNWKTDKSQFGHARRIGAILDDAEVVSVTIGLR